MGGGWARRVDPRKSTYLPMWCWALTGWTNVQHAIDVLLPHMVAKRTEAGLVLAVLINRSPHAPYTEADWNRYAEWKGYIQSTGGVRRNDRNSRNRGGDSGPTSGLMETVGRG